MSCYAESLESKLNSYRVIATSFQNGHHCDRYLADLLGVKSAKLLVLVSKHTCIETS